ncbi:MAG: uracil-DNA glycosylase family protein [Sphingomonadales bacterium]|nr:uracil-DNA glycosylase family protein [Sphingomonadales bacterium]MBD3774264.1 uracil-DNA glycosylase family protein [Paracoccaceae bacterium]
MADQVDDLRRAVAACRLCAAHLPNPPRPLAAFSSRARIVITSQAPGRLSHESGVPWDDPSGRRLRDWLGIDEGDFYDPQKVALLPMGFCYPGTGSSGDNPPRRECAPQWHGRIEEILPRERLTLLVGTYAHKSGLPRELGTTLEPRIRNALAVPDGPIALPHPSWRVVGWMKRNPWFADDVLPVVRERVAHALAAAGSEH